MNASTDKIGRLTTHVLDTAFGKPANGLKIELFKMVDGKAIVIKTIKTNDDGRADAPLLEGAELEQGFYELHFHVGDYYKQPEPVSFLGVVPVRFGVCETDQHYHVPLLVSPFGYSTYRGS
jgi:5-hydroxyisourate hydrolase